MRKITLLTAAIVAISSFYNFTFAQQVGDYKVQTEAIIKSLGVKGDIKSMFEKYYVTEYNDNDSVAKFTNGSKYSFDKYGNITSCKNEKPNDTSPSFNNMPDSFKCEVVDKRWSTLHFFINDKEIKRLALTYDKVGVVNSVSTYEGDSIVSVDSCIDSYYSKNKKRERVIKTYKYNREYEKSYFKFDEQGKLVERYISMNHIAGSNDFFVYDTKNNEIELYTMRDGVKYKQILTSYDKKGNKILVKKYIKGNLSTTESYVYNKNNLPISIILETNGKITTTEMVYDKKGNLIEESVSSNKNPGKYDSRKIKEYDKKGNILYSKEIIMDKVELEEFYTYDKNGSCIKKIQNYGNNKVVVDREITYY